jgi:hypothetical protein
MQDSAQAIETGTGRTESAYAWLRLLVAVLLGTIGSVGMWAYVVALPAVQADFGVARWRCWASASVRLPSAGWSTGSASSDP